MVSAAESPHGVILETSRLRLATWSREEWAELRPLATDPQVVRYINAGQPLPDERIQEFVTRQCGHWEKSRFCMWKLLPRESDELIGFCGLQPLPETTEIEIGWWLAPARWGKGLATEAARLAMAYGFEEARLDRIVAVAHPANRASLRVMEKLGMKFEKETVHRGFDVVLYGIARMDYAAGEKRA
jgi:[ribosomal protein S5]-alanine N-acetyltransferase